MPDPIDLSQQKTPPPRREPARPDRTETVAGPARPPAFPRGADPSGDETSVDEAGNPFTEAISEVTAAAASQPNDDDAVSNFARETIPSERPVGPSRIGAKSHVASGMAGAERLGQYRLVKELGRGGMGVVYEGIQDKLDRHVALKVLPEHLARNEDLVARFLVEARAVARFHHPNIAAIYEIAEDDGVHYFAMEYVEGRTLSDLIVKRDLEEIEECVRIVRDCAKALDYAHNSGVIHRDIKPSNIMLNTKGEVKIMDFGLARMEGDERLTQTGMTLGTPAYMSPEQAGSKLAGPVDRRSDIYSLGVVLYETLTLRIPFDGRSKLEILRNIVDEKAPAPRKWRPDIPKELEDIVMRALTKRADERFQTAKEFADALESFLASMKPHAAISRVHQPLDRRLLIGVAVLTGIVALALGVWLAGLMGRASETKIAAVEGDGLGSATTVDGVNGTGTTAAPRTAAQLLAAGDEWGAAMQAVEIARTQKLRGADTSEPDKVINSVRRRWTERAKAARDSFDDRRAAEALVSLYALAAEQEGSALEAPTLGFDEDEASLAEPPTARLERWLTGATNAGSGAAEAIAAWAHAHGTSVIAHEHHAFLGALAGVMAESEATVANAAALQFALAEEAPTAPVQRARTVALLNILKTHEMPGLELFRANAAYRPTIDWLPQALGWTEYRHRLRAALTEANVFDAEPSGDAADAPSARLRWDRFDVAATTDRVMGFASSGESAFQGDFLPGDPLPQNPPRLQYQDLPGGESVLLRATVVDPRHVAGRRRLIELYPLASDHGLPITAPAAMLSAGTARPWERFVTSVPLGDGSAPMLYWYVEVSPDRLRWIAVPDANNSGTFEDDIPLHTFAPIVPDLPLVSRLGTRTPLGLRINEVVEQNNRLGLDFDIVGAREGVLSAGDVRFGLRIVDLDSDGVFTDFAGADADEAPGAALTLQQLADGAQPTPVAPLSLADALQASPEDVRTREAAAQSAEAPMGMASGIAPYDAQYLEGSVLRMSDGDYLKLTQVAPGGGVLFIQREVGASLRGVIREAGTNRPIDGATITLTYANFEVTITSATGGRVLEPVYLGRADVRIEADGYETAEWPGITLTDRIVERFDQFLTPSSDTAGE